jgi:hypothetical protein
LFCEIQKKERKKWTGNNFVLENRIVSVPRSDRKGYSKRMGIKASTANGGAGQQSPRTRTFSTSSSSGDVMTATGGGTGFNILRTGGNGGIHDVGSLRARSLSYHVAGVVPYEISSASPETDSSADDNAASALALGRVYTTTSLPAHIFSLNGEYQFNVLVSTSTTYMGKSLLKFVFWLWEIS